MDATAGGSVLRRGRQMTFVPAQQDLFQVDRSSRQAERLRTLPWPAQERFPVNRPGARVRDVVWDDIAGSPDPLLVVGYSAIAEVIHMVSDWLQHKHDGTVRILLGTEPFASSRHHFRSPGAEFTDEVRRFWLEDQSISLHQCGQIVEAIEAIAAGRLRARFVGGSPRLHAKVYVGQGAVTVGSSNFTASGLGHQIEANTRFERGSDPSRFREAVQLAENLWQVGEACDDELARLLRAMLQVVSWQEALARACSDLLEGQWANRYLTGAVTAEEPLWPSQRFGIAQALWITENVGSVLVADATGSGKTRMGAHLVRAVRDRLWATGRVRSDVTTLVCPPAVTEVWETEALRCGLQLRAVSHGLLSRDRADGARPERTAVQQAQILAVDEAHNFLNTGSSRTRRVLNSFADHIALFTATPISRGPRDLLNLVGLLGPDNFEDRTLEVLASLERKQFFGDQIPDDDLQAIRREIQRFTVRRTKSDINALVDHEPEQYRHPNTGRVCRYPAHKPRVYETGETSDDESAAARIRSTSLQLVGIAQLERRLAVPPGLRRYYDDERWLAFRLTAIRGLAIHHVLDALRSSRAALTEHLVGSGRAAADFHLPSNFKAAESGDTIGKLARRADEGPPAVELDCGLPDWLVDRDAWVAACAAERACYEQVLHVLRLLSGAREDAKGALLAELCATHERVLAFDRHPITLAVLHSQLAGLVPAEVDTLVAVGGPSSGRRAVARRFAPDASGRAIALCSDALNEGLNLQGASCIVHLDLPTTLRIAEQRVGRVDRMDSRHDAIEAWWPNDGPAFATRAFEKLARRTHESQALLGANLALPDLAIDDGADIVSVKTEIAEATESAERWDGISDALDPVRNLVSGAEALVNQATYDAYRRVPNRVIARVAPLASSSAWAFFAVSATTHGAPRWMLLEGARASKATVDLNDVAARLRDHLSDDPPAHDLDDVAIRILDTMIDAASRFEYQLLPRRMRRALAQMSVVLGAWTRRLQRESDEDGAEHLRSLARLSDVGSGPPPVELSLVAERWLSLVGPRLEQKRRERRSARYVLLKDIERDLIADPLPLDQVLDGFSGLPESKPLADRISACILGVPTS